MLNHKDLWGAGTQYITDSFRNNNNSKYTVLDSNVPNNVRKKSNGFSSPALTEAKNFFGDNWRFFIFCFDVSTKPDHQLKLQPRKNYRKKKKKSMNRHP